MDEGVIIISSSSETVKMADCHSQVDDERSSGKKDSIPKKVCQASQDTHVND